MREKGEGGRKIETRGNISACWLRCVYVGKFSGSFDLVFVAISPSA